MNWKKKGTSLWGVLTLLLVLGVTVGLVVAELDHETDLEDDEEDPSVKYKHLEENGLEIEYNSPKPSEVDSVYFWESFDDPDVAQKRWHVSRAQKEGQDGVSKYDGEWGFQLPQRIIFGEDRALVLKSKAKHAAIAAKLDKPFNFQNNPLFVQYEVNFQNGMDCGGAYIKLLSHSAAQDLNKFTDKTPYTIMFGPDKCGNDYKLHFIFRHKNPVNGSFEEKHAKKPNTRLEENYSDKIPHLYLLKLFPDSTFQVLVDGSLVNSGSLLTDMLPPVNPPLEIPDASDTKPADWDERETIPDISVTKPEDWDDDAPAKIGDPNAVMPNGWLEDEESMIPDEEAKKPDDWDEGMDGEWEPPLKNNPVCESAPGCGLWSPPMIDNPNFKGKWRQPMMSNPTYKGKWSPRMIPNPDYFDDKEPFKMTPIGAVGIEIWAMTDLILFDNFIITDNEKVLQDWTSQTYDLKKRAIDKDAEGVFGRLLSYTNAHPWLWAVYTVVIGLPLVLILTFCCGSSQDKRDEFRNKKTDDYVEDELETEGESRFNTSGAGSTPFQSMDKEQLEKHLGTDGGSASSSPYYSMDKEQLEEQMGFEAALDEDDVEDDEGEENSSDGCSTTEEDDEPVGPSREDFEYKESPIDKFEQPDSSSGDGGLQKRKPRKE